MSTRPLVSARIASAISLARVFIGWVTGRLLAYLYVNSAFWANAPSAGRPSVPAAAPARIWRRVISMDLVSVVFDEFRSPGRRPMWGGGPNGVDCESLCVPPDSPPARRL